MATSPLFQFFCFFFDCGFLVPKWCCVFFEVSSKCCMNKELQLCFFVAAAAAMPYKLGTNQELLKWIFVLLPWFLPVLSINFFPTIFYKAAKLYGKPFAGCCLLCVSLALLRNNCCLNNSERCWKKGLQRNKKKKFVSWFFCWSLSKRLIVDSIQPKGKN